MIGVLDATWAAPSLSNVVVREGQPRTGLDFALIKGTLIQGRVTEGTRPPALRGRAGDAHRARAPLAEGTPPAGVVERATPPGIDHRPGGPLPLPRRPRPVPVDRAAVERQPPIAIEVKAEAELVHDLALRTRRERLRQRPGGREDPGRGSPRRRPRGLPAWRRGGRGTSPLPMTRGGSGWCGCPVSTSYTRRTKNGMAGFAPFPEKGDTVKVVVAPATRLDRPGRRLRREARSRADGRRGYRPREGRLAQVDSLRVRHPTRRPGPFRRTGGPVGSVGEISVYHRSNAHVPDPPHRREIRGPRAGPVEIPDLVIPAARPKK